MSALGMLKTVARTELKELIPDVSDETLLYLNRAIQAAYDLGESERQKLLEEIESLNDQLDSSHDHCLGEDL